jgi:two-component system response regulator RegA
MKTSPPEADGATFAGEPDGDRSLLIVDDDKPFLTRLSRAMEARGFVVTQKVWQRLMRKLRLLPSLICV